MCLTYGKYSNKMCVNRITSSGSRCVYCILRTCMLVNVHRWQAINKIWCVLGKTFLQLVIATADINVIYRNLVFSNAIYID